jgi:hypothetical protein
MSSGNFSRGVTLASVWQLSVQIGRPSMALLNEHQALFLNLRY